MTDVFSSTTINIRPTASVYATYRRLSYKPWFAIAEFLDNSTQNYYDHEDELEKAYRKKTKFGKLHIEIIYDDQNRTLTVVDNANGMEFDELIRAVTLDKPPENRKGRCEYGMGLKTAACWFGATWTIITTRLGSGRELTARIHVPDLINNHNEEIIVNERSVDIDSHYTNIIIENLYKPIRGRTTARIQDQLGSMYREDLRSGKIDIFWNGTPLTFQDPPILTENHGDGSSSTWKKRIVLDVPWEAENTVLHAEGWIGIRMPGSQRDAGMVLLRRGRVVVGGPGEGYKPTEVFGQGNTFRSQRLIGEINMDNWPVTQAKDAFDWSGGLEDAFIECLRKECQDYMDKAEGHRQINRSITYSDMQMAAEQTQHTLADDRFGKAVEQEISLPEPPKSEQQIKEDEAKLLKISDGPLEFSVRVGVDNWIFLLHWQDQLSDAHWMSVSYPGSNITNIFLNTAHPFFAQYINTPGFLELLQKFIIALALAERMARKVHSGDLIAPDDFRNFMNRVLRYSSEIEEGHHD